MSLEIWLLILLGVAWAVAIRYARKKRRESEQRIADLRRDTIDYLNSKREP